MQLIQYAAFKMRQFFDAGYCYFFPRLMPYWHQPTRSMRQAKTQAARLRLSVQGYLFAGNLLNLNQRVIYTQSELIRGIT